MHASAREENVRKSVQKYIADNVVNSGGPPDGIVAANVQWPDMAFDPGQQTHFLRVTMRDSRGEAYSSVATTGNTRGFLKVWTLFLDLFLKREWVRQQDKRHLLASTLDTIKGLFAIETRIACLDYQSGANTDLGKLQVIAREPNHPTDDAWLSGGWIVSLRWVEQDT